MNRAIFPIIFGRRHPDKLSDGASTPIKLIRLQIEQKVNGNFPLVHQIATTMTFKNTHNIIVEGAFEFTLPEKATICGYGLDVGGNIVDGVVVEKQTARIVFEKEVRKRIDPGFVELVTGNVFRTRVYPIEPNKTRTVRVIYQDQALINNTNYLYQIPIQFQNQLESLDIVLMCYDQFHGTPNFIKNFNDQRTNSIQFLDNKNGQYTAEWHLTNVQPSIDDAQIISYALPDSVKSTLSAVEKDSTIGGYFAINCILPKSNQRISTQLDIPSKKICILWDASLSRSNSKENRLLELNALKQIFDIWLNQIHQITIYLIIFRNNIDQQVSFEINKNNWKDFENIFQNLIYDGATNLSQLSSICLNDKIDYYFLISDCISTVNNESMHENFLSNFHAPLWILNGNHLHEPYDNDFIRYLTQYNRYGGGYLNREKLQFNSNDLINLIETIQINYVQIHSNINLKQIYPSKAISIPLESERFLLVGQISQPLPNSIQFELEFSMNNQSIRLPISLDIPSNETNYFGLIRRLWAQEKLNELNPFKDKYKSDIISLGLEYSLVSHFTSLLVLETLQQHLQYHICPAKSRTTLYNQYMQYKTKENDKKQTNILQLIQKWYNKCQWYDKIITDIDRHRAYLSKESTRNTFGTGSPSVFGIPIINSSSSNLPQTTSVFSSNIYSQHIPMFSTTTATSAPTSFSFGAAQFGSHTPPQQQQQPMYHPSVPSVNLLVTNDASSTTPVKTEETSVTVLNEYNPKSPYMTRISSSNNRTTAYLIYLDERTSNRQSPSFYFDVASYFFSATSFSSIIDKFNQKQETIQQVDQQSIEYGLRILTNILELELEAPQLYRMVAYKLMELKQWDLALSIFRKIYSLRSDEPQSLRDSALVLIELGQYEQAYKCLKQILTEIWDERFQNIYTIALLDLNRLLVLMNKTNPDIDKRLLRNLPVDIRIVIQWDTADTLISLSIKEPTGQICSSRYSPETDIGGQITNVSFRSDQPIEYLLRKAVDGKYSISLTLINNAQNTIIGVTTVLIYIYKYFGSAHEEKYIKTQRLSEINQTIDVGEIEFGNSNVEQLKNELDKTKDECRRLRDQIISGNEKSNLQSSIQHLNVACDGCSQTPIIGNRYKCIFCPNIDLCEHCQSQPIHSHTVDHPIICIRDSARYPSSTHLWNRSELVHFNVQCSICSTKPIVGIRYFCSRCSINLCEKCEFEGVHDVSHQRIKIVSPE